MSETIEVTGRAIRMTKIERGPPVRIVVDGHAIEGFAGESVAAALLAAGFRRLRASPRARLPRGAFCLMGVCQECVMIIDGRRMPACQAAVRDGLAVETVPV